MNFKNILPLLIITFLFACGNKKEVAETIPYVSVPSAEIVEDMRAFGGSDPVGIESVTIAENKMSIKVKYNGGCQKHEFKLIGHKMVSKSIPAQRSIKLFHNSNDDDCREMISETLVFEISAFAYDNNEITLRLDGYETPISYLPIR